MFLVGPLVMLSWGLVDYERPDDMPTRYGKAFARVAQTIHGVVGNPFTFPATAFCALRYGVRPSTFDGVAEYGYFIHDLHTGRELTDKVMRLVPGDTRFAVAGAGVLTDRGLEIPRSRTSRMTELKLSATAPQRTCSLRVTHGRFFSRALVGTAQFGPGISQTSVRLHADLFDSGINELIFESGCDITLSSVEFVDGSELHAETSLTRARRPLPVRPPPLQ